MGTLPTPHSTEYPEFAVRWTRANCQRLEEVGVLTYRYELIDGVILRKMGQHRFHNASVIRSIGWLIGAFGVDYVQSQSTMDVAPEDNPTSEPEPDVVLLHVPQSHLTGDNPAPQDVRLCIEVSDTTLQYDLNTKASLYARAGIPEYWVISLRDRAVYVHTEPLDGAYRVRTVHEETEAIAPISATATIVRVADLLPPAEGRPIDRDQQGV